MRERRDEAYVLTTQELGDTDVIVTLLTRCYGRVRGVARGARRSRRRFGGALEPMTRASATWFERDGRELHRIEALEPLHAFAEMQAEPSCQAACAVLAELSAAFVPEQGADPQSFRLLGAVLEALERGGESTPLVRYFEFWLLRVHGLLPDLDRCAACGRAIEAGQTLPVSRENGPRCSACPRAPDVRERVLTAGEREFLAAVRQRAPAGITDSGSAAREGGTVEWLLRGTLEAYAERTFRAYRHLGSARADEGRAR